MRITKEQYEEYQNLKKWAERERIIISAKSIENLENDIDEPIKKCVAMLALLRCEPTYSCCGFDYDGQPIHKSHQYGEPYIRMKNSLFSNSLTARIFRFGWQVVSVVGEVTLVWKGSANPYWRNMNCIHYSEEIVVAIDYLEKLLLSNKDSMMDEVVLFDTNVQAKKSIKSWQYPPKREWVIRKQDVI